MAISEHRLVDIGSHSLALYPHGPEPSSSDAPVVLFVSGVASSSLVWAPVIRQLPPSFRSYTYDRSGYRNSESGPTPPTAENIARELQQMIAKAPLANPLILVGHSWAGVLIHEFLARAGTEQIAGVVFVDANHETMPFVLNVNDPALSQLRQGLEFYSAIGLTEDHQMTDKEWTSFREDESTEKFLTTAEKEDAEYAPSFQTLRNKGLSNNFLGNKPVYVIGGLRSKDWTSIYNAGVARGNGTTDQRRHVQGLIRTADGKTQALMAEFAKLSTRSKVILARSSGHFVHVSEPEIVVDGIQWVLDRVQ